MTDYTIETVDSSFSNDNNKRARLAQSVGSSPISGVWNFCFSFWEVKKMIQILLIIQLSRKVDLHLSKALFSLNSDNLQLHCFFGLETLFYCSFFCPLNQTCKTLQTVQVAPTQNKEAVGSAFHFEQNKTSRDCMPGRDLYLVWITYETSCNYSCRKRKI